MRLVIFIVLASFALADEYKVYPQDVSVLSGGNAGRLSELWVGKDGLEIRRWAGPIFFWEAEGSAALPVTNSLSTVNEMIARLRANSREPVLAPVDYLRLAVQVYCKVGLAGEYVPPGAPYDREHYVRVLKTKVSKDVFAKIESILNSPVEIIEGNSYSYEYTYVCRNGAIEKIVINGSVELAMILSVQTSMLAPPGTIPAFDFVPPIE